MRRTFAFLFALLAAITAAVSLSLLLTTGASAVTVGIAPGIKRALAETSAKALLRLPHLEKTSASAKATKKPRASL